MPGGAKRRPQAQKDPERARELLRSAHRSARALDAAVLEREIEELSTRGRISLDEDAGELPEPTATLGLTAREAEVLLLLARGLSNKEIADDLFISAKTASVHVPHPHEAGVTSRTEAAAVAFKHGPMDTPTAD